MRRPNTITDGADRLRVRPWKGDPSIAFLSPSPGQTPTIRGLQRALEGIRSGGFAAVLTPAMTPAEQSPFLDVGFVEHERLHLLRHQNREIPGTRVDGIHLRRGRNSDIPDVLDVDGRAFDSFWKFDQISLLDARIATPHSRFRVATLRHRIVGYHITGRAGTVGYLQRLAVDPSVHGRGIGTALIGDALGWCHRRQCSTVLVNTQEINTRALALYRHLGFIPEPSGLAVLRLDFEQRVEP
ncbi:RimI Acetyltransferases [Acidimicrobiia bacterium]